MKLIIAALLILGSQAHAVELAEIFGDHMVLQRGKPVAIWGTAEPEEAVVVQFKAQTLKTTADPDGNWRVRLESLKTSHKPAELTVNDIVLKDVLVGEVWLASGQSNMFWPLGPISNQRGKWPGVENGEAEVEKANYPDIRLNSQIGHEFGIDGWRVCNPENARGFSAVAFFFGRELHNELDVPIGLIARSFGGTSLQAWTPKPELLEVPFVRKHVELYPKVRPQILEWNKRFRAFRAQIDAGVAPKPNRPEFLSEEIELAKRLLAQGNLHARYIEPINPYTIRGFIWYQGESQTVFASLTLAMEDMLAALIKGRRRLWEDENMPFYFVQFPLYNNPTKGTNWHLAREVLRRVHERVPHTGMAVTYDFSDPDNVHPPEKQEVGRRLALWALADSYGVNVVPSGPLFDRMSIEERSAIIHFDHSTSKLDSSDGEPLRGFQLAGADGVFHEAEAVIDGTRVVLNSISVSEPKDVRFFFGGADAPNLINAAGLPASPFTTESLK
ncbi:MAG: sialate O-acetylesterase [Verrucomicrobiales bacterium]|jgi:sialate O-acetylesterase